MCRQAMHEECVFACFRQELFIHLIGLKDFHALRQFPFLAHARPDVGVDGVRAFYIIR